MKILFVITGLGMGGAENILVNLADVFASQGHQVRIVYLTGAAHVLPKNPQIFITGIDMAGPRHLLDAYLRLRTVVRQFRPDVVHSHMVHANLLCRLVRLSVKIPRLVCTAHSNNEGGRLRMLAYRLSDGLADISTNVSQQAVQAFISQGAVRAGRMVSVPNGIDTDRFKFVKTARFELESELDLRGRQLLLAVGRFDTAKDYPTLLHAIKKLYIKRQDFKLIVIGEGLLKYELQELTDALGLNSCVSFIGNRYNVEKYMSAADIFVLSSAWEGFGLVVAEAMACERVVVATRCGGVTEVIGDAGMLVDIKDPQALSNALNRSLDLDSDVRLMMGRNARDRIINEYSLVSTAEKYLKLYS